MNDQTQEGNPIVEVEDLNTNAVVKFHAEWNDTLAHVWDKAYSELHEVRGRLDELQCHSGESLMSHLNQSLAELHEHHVCPSRKFQIKRETGGA